MSDKYNQTIKVSDFKQGLKNRFSVLGKNLDSHDRMQIAINLRIALATVTRYMDGTLDDIRNFALAENIITEAENISNRKGTISQNSSKAVA